MRMWRWMYKVTEKIGKEIFLFMNIASIEDKLRENYLR